MTPSGESNTPAAELRAREARRMELEVGARAIRCPACGAMPGEPCTANELGDPAARMHKPRIRLSIYLPVPG